MRADGPSPATSYRPDVDGLRAVAVLGVLFYHLDATGLSIPGGFTGVDVFFVISGYLITQLLQPRDHAPAPAATRLLEFYIRRFWRLFPALIVMIGATLAAGYYLLIPADFAVAGESAWFSLFALGNWFFYANTGYFDQAAELMPLLHTWSLAVEEQFYLVWPVLLFAAFALGRRSALIAAVVITIVSFAGSVYWMEFDAKAAFYHPLTRAWELGFGALLALAPGLRLGKTASAAECLGILLIGYSFFFLADTDPFPGWNALFSCLGAALIVVPKTTTTFVQRALGSAPMRGIGLISYSLYLWHWPILVFTRHVQGAELSIFATFFVLALSFILAYASWRWIEQPFRRPAHRKRNTPIAVGAFSIVCVCAVTVFTTEGLRSRLPATTAPFADRMTMWEWPGANGNPITIGDWGATTDRVFVWGDSHAEHLAPLFSAAAGAGAIKILSGCAANVDGVVTQLPAKDAAHNRRCQGHHHSAMRTVATEKPHTVVLAAAWSTLIHDLAPSAPAVDGVTILRSSLLAQVETLAATAPRVVLVGQIPYWRSDPIPCMTAYLSGFGHGACDGVPQLPRSALPAHHASVNTLLSDLAASYANVEFVNTTNALCSAEQCSVFVNGEFLYMDASHLRRNLTRGAELELARVLHIPSILRNERYSLTTLP